MKAISLCFKIASVLIFLLSNAYAQTSLNVAKLGSWYSGNNSTVIFTQGNYAYHGSKDIFTVFEISTISAGHITGIGQYVAPNNIQRIQVVGNFAYLLIQNTGLQIVDVSDPYNPVASGMLMLSDYPNNMIVEGNNVFITSYNGLTVIDVSNPSNPVVSGSYVPSGSALLHDVKVQGNYAFVASQASGVRVCNIQNLSAITEVGSYYPGNYFQSKLIQIYGNYAYIIYVDDGSLTKLLKIEVLDITNPANPTLLNTVLVGLISSSTYHNCYLTGNKLYVLINASSSSSTPKIYLYDLNNPVLPVNLGTLDLSDSPFNLNTNNLLFSVSQNQNFLFCPKKYGFCVYDISNPSNSIIVTYYFDVGQIMAISKYGNFIFTFENFSSGSLGDFRSGIRVFDVTNPNAPLLVNSHFLTSISPSSFTKLHIEGHYLYVTNLQEWVNQSNGFVIFDISNPLSITELGAFKVPNAQSSGVEIVGDYAYVCFLDKGLFIVDISNPLMPVLVGSTILNGNAEAMQIKIHGNYALISDKQNFLHVIDVSNPAVPVQITTHILAPPPNMYNRGCNIFISGNLAYSAVPSPSGTGVVVTDISNPFNLQNIASYSGITTATDLSLSGNIMYCTDLNNGLQVVDISNIASAQLVGYFYLFSAYSYGVIGEGDYIYLTTLKKGLYILKNEYQTNVEVMPKKPDLLKIYPNPMHDFAVVKIPEAFHQSQNITIRVFDIHGREMNVPVYYHHSEIIIKRNALNEGLYHIEMRDENRNIAKGRFIVN